VTRRQTGREWRSDSGFTIIEVIVAAAVLMLGILASVGAFQSSRVLTLVSERQTSMAHRAQQELERVEALSYTQIAMSAAPTHSASALNPDFYVGSGTFQYDRSDATKTEPFVVDSTNGTITPGSAGCADGCSGTWSDGRLSGEIFTFVTWYTDGSNGSRCSPGCPASNDFKRITVAVTLSNTTLRPPQPVWASTFKADPSAAPVGAPTNGQPNPVTSATTTCQDSSGQAVPCTNGLSGGGSAVTFYPTDSSYNATYTAPCADNAPHPTILGLIPLVQPPVPDQMTSSVPSSCSGFVSNPPCFSTGVGCLPGVGGRELVPPSSGGSCGSPPSDNTKSEFWVTPSLALNTKVTGSGAMTLYTQTAGGASINVTLCLQLYLEPPALLGVLSGLLTQPIGAVVTVNVQAYPGVPTPITFNFNNNSSATVSILGTRVGVAMWLAASAQNVVLIYDHPNFTSSMQLILK
jgi:Tfp pilus assembly protein PilV